MAIHYNLSSAFNTKLSQHDPQPALAAQSGDHEAPRQSGGDSAIEIVQLVRTVLVMPITQHSSLLTTRGLVRQRILLGQVFMIYHIMTLGGLSAVCWH
jgi:hypothetical protein